MDYYELFQESPGAFFLILILSLAVTLVTYCAFPLIFAKTRKKQITAKTYKKYCYIVNIIVAVIFKVVNGDTASSFGPYLLWTWVFSRQGEKILNRKGLLTAPNEEAHNGTQKKQSDAKTARANDDISPPAEHFIPEQADNRHSLSKVGEQPKRYGNYNVHANDTALQSSPAPQSISFCRKCGAKLLDGSQFCHKCGTKAMVEATITEKPIKAAQITPIEKLVLLTVGLPAVIADKSEEAMNIVKNKYVYCDAIIFVEFFIRANALELAPSREVAMRFSDSYIEAVIKETINTVPDTETFFTDMFYSRATLYDGIVMNSEEPIMDIVEVLTHIIHKEIDDDNYVTTDDRNYRYFGGIFESLAIKTELVGLFQCINDVTEDTMKELKDYLKML